MSFKNALPVLLIFTSIFFTSSIHGVSALSVNLTMPGDAYSSPSKNVTFGCNATDENLTNITFFLWDSDDIIYYNNTRSISGTFNETNWTVNDTVPGDYHWNCLAYDNESNNVWAAGNRSLHINLFYLFETNNENDFTESIAIGDLDNDGDLDYISGNYAQPNRVYLNDGTGNFTLFENTAELGGTQFVALGDLDNDGDLDYISANYQEENNVYLNNGSGHFTLHANNSGNGNEETRSIVIADLDNDGDLDYAAANMGGSGGYEIEIYKNDGLANFTNFQNITATSNYYTIAGGDLDNDGDIDLVAGGIPVQGTYIYDNDGTGYFTIGSGLGNTLYTKDISIADLDNDGNLDIIETSDRNYQNTSIFLNDGNGGFGPTKDTSFGNKNVTFSVSPGDFDNDGFVDILIGNDAQKTCIYKNDGSGNFYDYTFFEDVASAAGTRSIASGDLDNDGDLDFVLGNYGFNDVYLNTKNDNNYINVYVIGSSQNVSRDAVGTKVHVTNSNGYLESFREVSSADSSKNSPHQLHLGLAESETYSINATFITGKVVSCTVQPPKNFIIYENGSGTSGVSCHIIDFSPSIVSMEPSNGNVTTEPEANFSCNASDDNELTSLTLYVWNSTNDLYSQSTIPISGTNNFSYWFIPTIAPDTYVWNCMACDNSSQCVKNPSNYTLSLLIRNRLVVKLVLNNTISDVYIPGVGETPSSNVDYHYGAPPSYYIVSYLNNIASGVVFSSRIPRLIAAGGDEDSHYLKLEQDIENSRVLLAYTLGDWNVVNNRIPLIEQGNFLSNILPSFSFGLGKNHLSELTLFYDNIDMQGLLRIGSGTQRIVINNNGTSLGRTSIVINQNN